jgi:DNA repair exonuclease SbcCD ATPase subunit
MAAQAEDPIQALRAPLEARLKELQAEAQDAEELEREIAERREKLGNLAAMAREAKRIERALAALEGATPKPREMMTAHEEEEAKRKIKELVRTEMGAPTIGKKLGIDGRIAARLARQTDGITQNPNGKFAPIP